MSLSKSQLDYMKKHSGFLLLLLATIPAIAAAANGIAGIVNSTKQTSEMVRHNKAIEEKLGSGISSDAVAPILIADKMLSTALKNFGLGGWVKNLKDAAWGNVLYKM